MKSSYRSLIACAVLGGVIAAAFLGFKHLRQKEQNSRFISNLDAKFKTYHKTQIEDVAEGDWELVCESSGYDEELKLKDYGRTYPNVGEMQDGSWGLIFVFRDGDFYSITGSCRQGYNIKFPNVRCLSRKQAILELSSNIDASCKKLIAK